MTTDEVTILIVEDEPPIRRLLRATLAAQDYRTLEATTGAEALSALEERLHVAEEARDDALRKAAATAAELEEKSLCSDAPAARTRAYDAMLAAKERAREAEAAAEAGGERPR